MTLIGRNERSINYTQMIECDSNRSVFQVDLKGRETSLSLCLSQRRRVSGVKGRAVTPSRTSKNKEPPAVIAESRCAKESLRIPGIP